MQSLLVPPDPPPSVANAINSIVREPTPDEVASWTTLRQVAAWAKLKGEITWPVSKAGSLVRLLAGVDEEVDDLDISDLASVSPKQFEARLTTWMYSKAPRPSLDEVALSELRHG